MQLKVSVTGESSFSLIEPRKRNTWRFYEWVNFSMFCFKGVKLCVPLNIVLFWKCAILWKKFSKILKYFRWVIKRRHCTFIMIFIRFVTILILSSKFTMWWTLGTFLNDYFPKLKTSCMSNNIMWNKFL